jgi:hypothetical protein
MSHLTNEQELVLVTVLSLGALLGLESHVEELNRILQASVALSSEDPLMHDSDRWNCFHRPTEYMELMNRKHNNDTAPQSHKSVPHVFIR